jgi:hypothetical protein
MHCAVTWQYSPRKYLRPTTLTTASSWFMPISNRPPQGHCEILGNPNPEPDHPHQVMGTDTMAYTASALSFMLENLGKTVIFTGARVGLRRYGDGTCGTAQLRVVQRVTGCRTECAGALRGRLFRREAKPPRLDGRAPHPRYSRGACPACASPQKHRAALSQHSSEGRFVPGLHLLRRCPLPRQPSEKGGLGRISRVRMLSHLFCTHAFPPGIAGSASARAPAPHQRRGSPRRAVRRCRAAGCACAAPAGCAGSAC